MNHHIYIFALNFFYSSRYPCRLLVLSLVENNYIGGLQVTVYFNVPCKISHTFFKLVYFRLSRIHNVKVATQVLSKLNQLIDILKFRFCHFHKCVLMSWMKKWDLNPRPHVSSVNSCFTTTYTKTQNHYKIHNWTLKVKKLNN